MTTTKLGKVFELKYDSTKAEEIAALVEIAENVAPGTCLADVFNKKFVDWVAAQIENDFSLNIMSQLEEQARRLSSKEEILRQAYQLASQAEDARAELQSEVDRMAAEIIRLKAKLYDMMEAK